MSKIEKELLEATGLKKKVAEKRQAYLTRLIGAVQDLGNDDWDKISTAAQKWVNAGAKVINDETGDVADFPDSGKDKEGDKEERPSKTSRRGGKEEVTDAEAGDNGEGEAEKPARGRGGKGKDKEEASARSSRRGGKDAEDEKPARTSRRGGKDEDDEKPARAAKLAKERKGGAQVAIKTHVIKNPKATTEAIAEALAKKGLDVTPSAVSTIRSGTLQTLRLIKDLGMPKGEF